MSYIEVLKELGKLKDAGILTEEEFQAWLSEQALEIDDDDDDW